MDGAQTVSAENKILINDLKQLAGAEESRVSIISAIYIRLNDEMRLKNIQDVKKDISYGAKSFGQLPEKYAVSMNSIVRSYIEEINKFMKAYNDQFINVLNVIHNAEQKQKYYFYKIRENTIMKSVCILAGKPEDSYKVLDEEILDYKKKLVLYERIIARCDKEFEDCKNRREEDFKELFEIKQEQALAVVQKVNPITKIINKIKNMFHGYENFSKYVLQKYAARINKMKVETIEMYVNKTKQNTVNFASEIEEMTGAA